MIPKTAVKMKEMRNRRVKNGRKQTVVASRRKKRMGRMKSQPMKKADREPSSKIFLNNFSELLAV